MVLQPDHQSISITQIRPAMVKFSKLYHAFDVYTQCSQRKEKEKRKIFISSIQYVGLFFQNPGNASD